MKTFLIVGVAALFLGGVFAATTTSTSTAKPEDGEMQTQEVEIKGSNETKEFLEDFKKVAVALDQGRHADKEKVITDFVTKYGKVRICKYIAPEFKKKEEDMTDELKALKTSCEDEKQGDKEFIKVAKDNFVGSHHTTH